MKVRLVSRGGSPVSDKPVTEPQMPQQSIAPSMETPQQQIQAAEQQGGGILRNIGRLGARAIESAVSLPGELARMVPNELLAPTPGNPRPNLIKLAQQIPERKTLEEYISTPILESVFGEGAAQPQGKLEKNLDSVVKTAVPLMIGGPSNLIARGAQALGIAGAGQLAKWGAKEVGASKGIQRGVKLGTMIGTSMIGVPNAKKIGSALRNKAKELIPPSEKVIATPIEKVFARIRNDLNKGFIQDAPSVKFMNEVMDNAAPKLTPHLSKNALNKTFGLRKGVKTVSIQDLLGTRDKYNEVYGTLNGKTHELMHDVIEAFKESYKSASKEVQPLLKDFETGQNILKATYDYPGIVDFIKRTPKLTGATGGAALVTSLFVNPAKVAVGLVIPALVKGGYDLFGRILSSPGMRNYYANLTKSLISERPAASIKWANKLYSSLKKKDPEVIKEIESNNAPPSPSSRQYLKVRVVKK